MKKLMSMKSVQLDRTITKVTMTRGYSFFFHVMSKRRKKREKEKKKSNFFSKMMMNHILRTAAVMTLSANVFKPLPAFTLLNSTYGRKINTIKHTNCLLFLFLYQKGSKYKIKTVQIDDI
jgi:hypothetical protein